MSSTSTSRRCAPASSRSCAAISAARPSRWCTRRRAPPSACRPSTCRRPSGGASASSDADIVALARQALIIEEHYGRPMDIEWGTDGATRQDLHPAGAPRDGAEPRRPHHPALLPQGPLARARDRPQHRPAHRRRHRRASSGTPREMARVQTGDVLVADMTDPDWEPVMKRAAAIVTNRGGRTCHAAIIARELGIPAVVGCGDATHTHPRGPGGDGVVRRGRHRLRLRGAAGVRAQADRARLRCRRSRSRS